jgi:hypothetical protein
MSTQHENIPIYTLLKEGYNHLFHIHGKDNDYGEVHKNYEKYNNHKQHIT